MSLLLRITLPIPLALTTAPGDTLLRTLPSFYSLWQLRFTEGNRCAQGNTIDEQQCWDLHCIYLFISVCACTCMCLYTHIRVHQSWPMSGGQRTVCRSQVSPLRCRYQGSNSSCKAHQPAPFPRTLSLAIVEVG